MNETVAALWRYPVKSIGGEPLDEAEVGPHGIVGDRSYGIRHLESGTILTARRRPELLFASATWQGGEVVIRLPDGTETADDTALSRWLADDVALVAAGESPGRFENPMDVENETDWVAWDGPEHTFHDSGRTQLSLVGVETLGEWDARRFRKNVIASGGGENDMVGGRLGIGPTVHDVPKLVARCVMVTRPQPDGIERDLDVFRTINRERGGTLGIGLRVVTTGRIAVGDRVESR